jgi:hypothetical protein
MKLEVDPLLQPEFVDCLDVTWPWTERQPVQRMYDLIVFGEFVAERRVIGLPKPPCTAAASKRLKTSASCQTFSISLYVKRDPSRKVAGLSQLMGFAP